MNFKSIIWHPVRGRIIFDFAAAIIAYGLVEFVNYFGFGVPLHYSEWFIYGLLITGFNYLLGIYSRLKTSPPTIKAIYLLLGVILTSWVMYLLRIPVWQIMLADIYVLILLVIPRWFLNLNRERLLPSQTFQFINTGSPILVIGGAGYIGSQIVEQLIKKGNKVKVLDTFFYNKEVFEKLKTNNLEIINGDITNLYALTQALANVRAVVHLAGIVGDPASSLDDELTRHLNIVTTRMITDQVRAMGIPRLIFASSCSVYGAAEETVNENSKLNPVSLYAQTKIDAERQILSEINDLFHPTILRFATVFGHSDRMRFDLVANLFTAQAYVNGKITVKGSNQWRPMVHVSDIARAIVMVLEAPLEKVSRQIFNVGDDSQNYTIGDMAKTAARVVIKSRNGKSIVIATDDTVDDPRNYHVSFEKIKKTLGFEAKTSLSQGMKEMHDHFLNGDYKKPFKDPLYSNLEMTKLISKEFHTEAYRKSHFSLMAK